MKVKLLSNGGYRFGDVVLEGKVFNAYKESNLANITAVDLLKAGVSPESVSPDDTDYPFYFDVECVIVEDE